MKYKLPIIILLILTAPGLQAQKKDAVDTSLSTQIIDKIWMDKTVDSVFSQFSDPNSLGAAVTIMQNGKVVTKKNYGLANLEHNIPYTHKTPVRLVYSMGREFMSVGLAMMEAEGLLRFDDKVRSYFPKLPQWSSEVTIQDLLNHSSGFDDEWSLLLLMTADMRSQVEPEQVLTLLYNQPKPQVEPGSGYMYNNTDFALLRLIMEIAAKQSLPDYLKMNLFDPLGMSSTLMNDDIEIIIPGLAESYYGYPYRKARFIKFSPGGNYRMVTSADDLEKWALAIDDKSSPVAKAFDRLYRDSRAIPVMNPEKHYAFGHEVRIVGNTEVIYHGGVDDSFYLIRIPSQQIAIIGIGNGGNFIGPIMQFANKLVPQPKDSAVEAIFFPADQVPLKREEKAAYTGRYFAKWTGYNSHVPSIRFYDIKLEGDSLNVYIYSYGKPITLTSFGNGYFKDVVEDVNVRLTKPHADSSMIMEVWPANEVKPRFLHRVEDRVDADEKYLQQYTGKFYSPHLDYYLRIVLNEEGDLIVKRPTVPDVKLDPHSKDQFIMEQWNGAYSVYMMATFNKNPKGEVEGFTLNDSRMMHHRFEKLQ